MEEKTRMANNYRISQALEHLYRIEDDDTLKENVKGACDLLLTIHNNNTSKKWISLDRMFEGEPWNRKPATLSKHQTK